MAQILSGREVASAMNDALLTRAGALAERGIPLRKPEEL